MDGDNRLVDVCIDTRVWVEESTGNSSGLHLIWLATPLHIEDVVAEIMKLKLLGATISSVSWRNAHGDYFYRDYK